MRGWLKLTIGLGVLAGLLVGADRTAVGVAEDEAADQLVSSGRLSSRPEVTIEGFPFLTQAVSGEFDGVKLAADDVQVSDGRQQVAVRSFRASLSGVSVGDSYHSATVRSATGSGLISYPDAAKLVQGADRLDLSYGGPGKVKASVAGFSIGEGKVHSEGNTVIADGFQLTGVAAALNGRVKDLLAPRSFTLSRLPAGLGLAGVTPEPDGLLLDFRGTDVRLIG
ncbi:DUF2993 domain-containing protein [Kitasatospora sp. NPDC048540]|uniref:LmeA family phospholipid-binding protein n=1 Tax=unclassified Kitasatospora TaxID=2633591 RepID=UPI00053A3F50|nr:DUF2993 domain-containing protein [Kitasatospora sp. MBT63]